MLSRHPVLAAVFIAVSSCGTPNPLYCEQHSDCRNALLPYCDALGQHPGSEGVSNTCIATPIFLNVTASGPGTVTSDPAGIDCGSQCQKSYVEGTVVTLTATPETGALFVAWSGACVGQGSCVVTMDASSTVAATFAISRTLIVQPAGSNSSAGSVVSDPVGINCPTTCEADFADGTAVTLTARESTGGTFVGWSGDANCPGLGPCTFDIVGPTTISPAFNIAGAYQYDLIAPSNPGHGTAVAYDDTGNLFVVGYFTGQVDFGAGPISTPGSGRDLFVVKLDPQRTVLWSRVFGGAGQDTAWAVELDGNGDAYITSTHSASVTIGADIHPASSSNSTGVLIKLGGANGSVVWTRRVLSNISGPVQLTLGALGGPIIANLSAASFSFSWYTPAGIHSSSSFFGVDPLSQLKGITSDGAGNVLIAGTYYGTVDFNGPLIAGGTTTSTGGSDIFLAKIAPGNSLSWLHSFGNPDPNQVGGLAVAPSGEVWIAGYFQNTIDFGGGPLTANGTDMYLVKYSQDGDWLLSKQIDAQAFPEALAVGPRGNVHMVGVFDGTINVGGGPIQWNGGMLDVFIANFDSQARHRWSRGVGGPTDTFFQPPWDRPGGASVSRDGNLSVTGQISDGVDFGGGTRSTGKFRADDVFVVVYGP